MARFSAFETFFFFLHYTLEPVSRPVTNGKYDLNVQCLQNKLPHPRQHLLFWLATEINFIKFRRLGPALVSSKSAHSAAAADTDRAGELGYKALWGLGGVLLHFLGGGEKQLLVPPLFRAVSSSLSYPLIF